MERLRVRPRSGTSPPRTRYAGDGRDRVYANEGQPDFVRCGGGAGLAVVDSLERVLDCERVVVR